MPSRILVVDDSAVTRKHVVTMLSASGRPYFVYDAVDGADALDKLAKARFDLVVSDWEMPRMSGMDLLKGMRGLKGYEATPFILMTSHSPRFGDVGRDGNKFFFLQKPFRSVDLLERVTSALYPVASPFANSKVIVRLRRSAA